ncbi:MAG: hypothetical protein MJ072_07075, partial [Clostridia bacterium]|nr:hypothetical protein [Clostridia bacterium]
DNCEGPYGNYYYSYFNHPDKWGDILLYIGGEYIANDGSAGVKNAVKDKHLYYNPIHARSRLAFVPITAPDTEENIPYIREDLELYDCFLENGLAGRWSYMFHPTVYGDKEIYYLQRTSHDRMRACIIIRRCPSDKRVIIFPKGLKEKEKYTVGFQVSDETFVKTGKELKEDGIVLNNLSPKELIYLNISSRPGKICIGASNTAVEKVYKRAEINVESFGVAIYWAKDQNGNKARYYEIARNGKIIGSTVKSLFLIAEQLGEDFAYYSSFGDRTKDYTDSCWSAEISNDLKLFKPMHFTPPSSFPGGACRGTPHHAGGIQRHWQDDTGAHRGAGFAPCSSEDYT